MKNNFSSNPINAIKDFFFSGKPIFHVDKNRYSDVFDEQTINLEFEGFQADRRRVRGDVMNIFRDFKKANAGYKKEKVLSRGKSQ